MKRLIISGSRILARHALLAAFVATGIVVALDIASGLYLRVYPLYFLPLAVVAVHRSRQASIQAVLFISATWALANYDPQRPVIYAVNVLSQLTAFTVVALLLNAQKTRADTQEELASTDQLTGLLNARGFYAGADRQLARQRRIPGPLALAYLDLDNFKQINSDLGHVGADHLLKEVGQAMQAALRENDIVARLGGDEFAVLLPGASTKAAGEVLARLRSSVTRATTRQKTPVTFSVGAVVFDTPAESVADMVHLSDKLMYTVKAGPKDGIVVRSASDLLRASSKFAILPG